MRWQKSWLPWLYLAPALLILAAYLVYPTVETLRLSFYDARGETFIGLENYRWVFTARPMRIAFRNNLLWIVVFTSTTVSLGLILAVMADRVRYESLFKSAVFLPMAISFAGAGVIWLFMYAYRPAQAPQIGLLNAILVDVFHTKPVAWLTNRHINNFSLIAVGVWIWTGFNLVILSAAYKGIPRELLEAARVDGASEWQIFWRIILPLMKPTLAVVTTTMIINVLKVFDIVYVMTNGNYDTEVIANRMYKEMFHFRNFGRASAIAVVLLLAILPVMLINMSRFLESGER